MYMYSGMSGRESRTCLRMVVQWCVRFFKLSSAFSLGCTFTGSISTAGGFLHIAAMGAANTDLRYADPLSFRAADSNLLA